MDFLSITYLTFGFLFIGAFSYFIGQQLSERWWRFIHVSVVVSGFLAVIAALSQISVARFDRQISNTVIEAQTDFRRIERSAESGLMACGLWWNDVANWDYVPKDSPCVVKAGGIPQSCAVCRIGHMVYQERNTSFGLVSADSQAMNRGDFLKYNFCSGNLTSERYKSICPIATKYSDTVTKLNDYYETMRTSRYIRFAKFIDPFLQYVLMIVLGLELGKILTDFSRSSTARKK